MKKLTFILVSLIAASAFVLSVLPSGETSGMIDQSKTVESDGESRSFYIGMGPWPHEYSQKGILEAIQIVHDNADLIMHHFDGRVPWVEAFKNQPYHPHVEHDLNTRLKNKKPGQKIYLAISAQDSERNKLADYWGKEKEMPLPRKWRNKYFDHPDVIKAFLNYARNLISRFEPDYFAYSMEVNTHFKDNDPDFDKFLVFAKEVYTTLKRENPNLPIFVTIASIDDRPLEVLKRTAKKIMPYTDYVALSTYPYFSFQTSQPTSNPKIIPKNWFSQWAQLAPEKPFAISETGWPAEDLDIDSFVQVHQKGNEQWQAQYVQLLFEECNRLNAEFINWFVPRDYDRGWNQMAEILGDDPHVVMMQQFGKMWRDNGLFDGRGRSRQSLKIWKEWLNRSVRK